MTTFLKVYKIFEDSQVPSLATNGSACFDIRAHIPFGTTIKYYDSYNVSRKIEVSANNKLIIEPKSRLLIPTGLIFDIPEGYSLRLHPRSGLSLKQGLILANCEGVIDSDYVDPVFAILLNSSGRQCEISHGDRICQAELVKNEKVNIINISEPPKTKSKRSGGFGSTGEK